MHAFLDNPESRASILKDIIMSNQKKTKEQLSIELQELQQAYNSLKLQYDKDITERKQAEQKIELYGTSQDITSLKQIENELVKAKENEERFKQLSNVTFEGVLLHNKGLAIDFNISFARMFGYDSEELIGENLIEKVIPKKYHEIIFENIAKNYAQPYEVIGKKKDGNLFPIELESRTINLNENDKIRVTAVRDITERKLAEEKLKESETRFDLAMEASKDGIFDWNLITNEIYYSPGWKSMLGYEDKELPNDFTVWEKLTKPEDVEQSWKMQQEVINKQRDRFKFEFKMKHKDGHWVDILSRAEAVFDDSGKAIRIVGTHVDISERQRSAKELEKSELLFRKMIEHMPDGVAIYQPIENSNDFIFLEVNKHAEIITNTTNKELIGCTLLQKFPNMINSPLLKALLKVRETGESLYLPPFYYKDKEREGWRENNIYKLPSGEIVAIFTDVTEVFQISEKLKNKNLDLEKAKEKAEESEARLLESQAATKLGSWKTDLSNLNVVWSKEIFNIFELDEKTFEPSHPAFLEFIHPEDRKKVDDAFVKSLDKNKYNSIEHRIITSKGNIKFIEERWRSIKNEQGDPIFAIGICQDITERKQVAQELEQHQIHLEELVKDRTKELEKKNEDLDKFNQLFVGREFRIKELRTEVEELKNKLSEK
jgi:PAS domain S-box-containing protein